MVTVHQAILTLLVLHIYTASAAPANSTEAEDADKIPIENDKLHSQHQPSPIEESKENNNATENQRQKRFYNHYGFGFPPISPVQYPTYSKRDQAADLGVYGIDDPLSQIQRQIQEIASLSRLPPPPPPPIPAHFPFYFPIIYIPQYCACGSNNDNTNTPTTRPDTTQTNKPSEDGETTTPDVTNRWPEMEDERQNWGLVVNDTNGDDGEDFSRPISFDPVVADASTIRPAPPVEHGSNQAGMAPGQRPTTARPSPPSNEIPPPPQPERPMPPMAASPFGSPASYPPNTVEGRREPPTTCDGAVLSCCHQPQVTYDCFAVLGCPDPTSFGSPCDPLVILKVIGKYQQFYGVRNG